MTSMLVAMTLAAAISPSGHWEGVVDVPQTSIAFEVDLVEVGGALTGAITIPSQHLKGLPLTTIVVKGTTITFGARADQLLEATVADDGTSMSGTFGMATYSFPFTLTRTGDGHLEPAPASAKIASTLEGEWKGMLADGSGDLHLTLTLHNDRDGFARGEMVNLDEGGLRIPLAITQTPAGVTLDTPVIAGSFAGALNAAGELVGTYRQGSVEVPLTFRRNE